MALDTASTKTTRVRKVSAVCPNGHVLLDRFCDVCGSPIPEGAITAGRRSSAPVRVPVPAAPAAPAPRPPPVGGVAAAPAARRDPVLPELRRQRPGRPVLRGLRIRLMTGALPAGNRVRARGRGRARQGRRPRGTRCGERASTGAARAGARRREAGSGIPPGFPFQWVAEGGSIVMPTSRPRPPPSEGAAGSVAVPLRIASAYRSRRRAAHRP